MAGAREAALAEIEAGAKRLAAGRYGEAERHFRLALKFAPRHPDALNLLGVALLRGDRVADAVAQLRDAVQVAPGVAGYRANLGYALLRNGEFEAALKELRGARALDPGGPQVAFYLALALRANGEVAEAEQLLRGVVDNMPHFLEARQELSKLEYEAGRLEQARRTLQASPVPLSPGQRLRLILTRLPPIPSSAAHIAQLRREFDQELDAFAAQAPRIADPRAEVDATSFYLSYHGLPNRALHEKLARLYLAAHPRLAWTAPHCAKPRASGRKLKIGVISRFLYRHSIGRTTRGLVAKLNRERFEVTAIFLPPVPRDEFSRAIAADAARSLFLPTTLEAARAAVAQLELDVLFYQDIGMDPFTYFLAFARLAPVQCLSFGHPDTTGIPNMDWFVTAERFELPGAEAHYSERLWRMPDVGTLAYYYHPAPNFAPPAREELGLPVSARLYACPQAPFKLHPDFDAIAARILREDGEGRLVLVGVGHEAWPRVLMARLENAMPDAMDRVIMLPPLKHDGYLGLLAASDVVLDTPHFNGMNSSLETFAVGTPVITRPGPLQRMRHTAGMYGAMGIEGLCAGSDDEYVQLALRIARDRDRRAWYSARIQAAQAALFEDERVIRGFERFFEDSVGETR